MAPSVPQPSFLATRRGKLTLALLAAVAFLDFIDASIVNLALPRIRGDLHFSVQGLQWVLSGYLLTYGGFMLLGGRAGDLLGRRRVLVAGTTLFALSSLAGGFAGSAGMLVGARLAQGLGAAMMLPAALSLLTTLFKEGSDRATALGVWGGVAGLASAAGVFLGGVLTEGPGWRWVLFVNPPIAVLLLGAIFWLIPGEHRRAPLARFDVLGSTLVTGGMLLLVYALVKAPDQGWGAGRSIGELAGAVALLGAFVINEKRTKNPLVPLSIFRVRGLAAANVTQLIALAGFLSMFFFLTLYMQNVLGYSPIQTGAAYLPLTFGVGISAGVSSQLIARTGTRPVIVVGALVAAGGLYYLSRVPVHGSYLADLFPGLMVVSFGLGAVFVAITTAANAGVPADKAGLAAALLNASQQVGGALGLAIFSAIATSHTNHLLAAHAAAPDALTAGFHRALLASSIFVIAAAIIALRTSNTRGEAREAIPNALAEPADGSRLRPDRRGLNDAA
jgi:EmrB/QacA subfamily drug resistance transporter